VREIDPNHRAQSGASRAAAASRLDLERAAAQRQHDRDTADILSALADADRCLSLGFYRAARVHGLRAVRLIMAGALT
jgi:hypothetical protein